MYVNRRLIILFVPVSLLLAAGVVAGLALRGWPGAGEPSAAFPEVVHQSPEIERAYRLASEAQRLFTQVACYCGCVNLPKDPHRHLLDCFMNEDGTFEPHAIGCSICADIANDAVAWQAQGKSADEVASLVDGKYESVGPSTAQ